MSEMSRRNSCGPPNSSISPSSPSRRSSIAACSVIAVAVGPCSVRADDFPRDNWHPGLSGRWGGAAVFSNSINDWFLGRGSSSIDDQSDDDLPDRGSEAWLDRATAGSDRPVSSRVPKPRRSGRGRAKTLVAPTAEFSSSREIRYAPKPSARELESEILGILRAKPSPSVANILHGKGGGWARLTPKEISLAVRRVQSRLKEVPRPRKQMKSPAPPRPSVANPSLELIRAAVLRIHRLRPLWATWEIAELLRNRGWSNVSTDLVKSIIPLPGMPQFRTANAARRQHRAKSIKKKAGGRTRRTSRQPALKPAPRQRANPDTPPPPARRQPAAEPVARGTEFCPSCGVRISVIGSCRCS